MTDDDGSADFSQTNKRGSAMGVSVAAIVVGAGLGALLRWYLATRFNAAFPQLPAGTLSANLLGGYLVGLAMALFLAIPNVSPIWRLLTVTGFLGGLTTFSTFSAEVVAALLEGQTLWALVTVLAHVVGSILMTLAGVASVRLLKPLF